jgi:hypothetical protein
MKPSSRSEGHIFSNRKFRLHEPKKHLAASLPNLFVVLRNFLSCQCQLPEYSTAFQIKNNQHLSAYNNTTYIIRINKIIK